MIQYSLLNLITIILAIYILIFFSNIKFYSDYQANISVDENTSRHAIIQAIIEENEGLRNGLTEILNFLKDNSKVLREFSLF